MATDNIYDVRGRIFDIQRFSMHDGPGIRTIVFFKGCYLRCRWCCNPESQEYDIQQMTLGGKTKTVGRDVTVREVLEELEQDRMYYIRSGGGITLSGGEAMAQPDFAFALLKACRLAGLDTAIETTAYADRDVVERLVPYIDHVLMDIKHMNSSKHVEFTSRPNEKILANAEYIANYCARHSNDLTVRVPVIPTFNDTAAEISDIAKFASSLPGVRALHLLPYHRLGQDKYAGIGRTYSLASITPPSNEKMHELAEAARAVCSLHVQVGG